jgi:hypothetical protein
VADGAVEADHGDLALAEARANGARAALFKDETEACVALAGALGKVLWKELRQHSPYPDWHSGAILRANGAVLEMIQNVFVKFRLVAVDELAVRGGSEQKQDGRHGDKTPEWTRSL